MLALHAGPSVTAKARSVMKSERVVKLMCLDIDTHCCCDLLPPRYRILVHYHIVARPFPASKSISFAEFFPTWKREIQALSSSPMHDSSPLLPPLSSGHLTQCSQALHIPLPSYRTV